MLIVYKIIQQNEKHNYVYREEAFLVNVHNILNITTHCHNEQQEAPLEQTKTTYDVKYDIGIYWFGRYN